MGDLQTVLAALASGFGRMADPYLLVACFGGTLAGTLVGVLPGLGPSAAIAVLLPLIYGTDPLTAIVVLSGIYYGAMYGGTITSVLLNVPGESASVVTTLDGFPLAKSGRAGVALGLAAIGSFIAGTVGIILLSLIAVPLASISLKFGPAEYFAIMVFAFIMTMALSGADWLKSTIAVVFGLLLATIGQDLVSGETRLTWGTVFLIDGINFVPVVVGLFGFAEIMDELANPSEFVGDKKATRLKLRSLFPSRAELSESFGSMIRGTAVGFIVGILPGAGAAIASFISYGIEKRLSSTPEKFGKGALQGVAGPESANNAASSAAFVPLLSLGIPGSATTAVLLSAFVILGIQPGPQLFASHPDVVWGLIASMYIGNLMLLFQNTAMIPMFVWLLGAAKRYLPVGVAALCFIGVYSVNNSLTDVWIMLAFAVIGVAFKSAGIPATPLVIAIVLGQEAEVALRQALVISAGSPMTLIEKPISAVLLACSLAIVVGPKIYSLVAGKRREP